MATNSDLKTYDQALVPQQFGLTNTGVICHFNSLLQGLIGCSAVIQATLDNPEYLSRTDTGQAFYKFVHAMIKMDYSKGNHNVRVENYSLTILKHLITDLRRRRPSFHYGPNQESASEGLVLLLDMMDDPNPISRVEKDEKTGVETVIYEENPISRLFYHRYDASIHCKECKVCVSQKLDSAVQFNLFHYDTLKKKPCNPEEFRKILRSHVSYLEDYQCERCGERAGGYRHYGLRMVPEILVCLFNIYDDLKVRTAQYFPTRISFPGITEGQQLIYRQVSQIEQSGSCNGGHYIARSIRADGKVYQFNDNSVSPSFLSPNPNVYMIFYHHERVIQSSK